MSNQKDKVEEDPDMAHGIHRYWVVKERCGSGFTARVGPEAEVPPASERVSNSLADDRLAAMIPAQD